MTVETPDHYGGKPIPDDAIEIALAAEKKDRNEREAPPLEGFIYVPSTKLYFAKERTLGDHDWYDIHIKLHKQNLRMPTIPQFVEFLKYLRVDPTAENTSIYNEITERRDPWRAEWLDANFYTKDDEVWVAYNHTVDSYGDVVPQKNEKLERHLMQDQTGISLEHWLNNPTKQGLPQENSEQGGLWYWHPRENRVVKFVASFSGPSLYCYGNSSDSNYNLGVFACAENLGGKQ